MGANTKRAAGLAVLGALMISGFAGCGGGDDTAKEMSAQRKLDDARKEGKRDAQIDQLQRDLREKKGGKQSPSATTTSGSSGRSARSGPTSCGNGLSAGPNTSCPFAGIVRESYPGSSASFEEYSPVTDKTYSMSCTTGSPHACRGGNNASVFFP